MKISFRETTGGVLGLCLALFGIAASISCGDDRACLTPQDSRCLNITCSEHGECVIMDNKPVCVCDDKYHNENDTSCVPDYATCDGVADGVFCDDGLFCTVGEVCTEGVCSGGQPRNCSDGDSCTEDSCDESSDMCVYTAMADDSPCDDGLFCTQAETCSGGICSGGSAIDCSDGDVCTLDLCDEMNDACDHPPVEDGIVCDDGNYCTLTDTCIAGTCVPMTFRDCSDGNPCTTDACDEAGDDCTHTPGADGMACDDGQYCSIGSTCSAGVCGAGTPRACSDGNPCTTDTCDEDADACLNTNLADGTSCDDGAYCTTVDVCTAGLCAGSTPRDCADGNACTSDVCNETTDACENPPVVDGTPCDDGQYCTMSDTCAAGTCVGTGARDCSDGDQCTSDACDDVADACVNANVPDGTVCSDGLFCTLGETCNSGVCANGTARDCTDGNPCTQDVCNDTSGTCDHVNLADGSACDDGQFCTLSDACQQGVCTGAINPCDDGNGCTLDSCDENADSCVNDSSAMDGAGCDDGHFCTIQDSCSGGACSGVSNPCDDSNACTLDSCDDPNGICIHQNVADNTGCDDGQYCTTGDVCLSGICSGAARNCADANVCTADSCNEVSDQCVNMAVADGNACDDGQYCNVGEICTAGSCGGGFALNCSDGNDCTSDTCDENNDVCVNTNVPNGTGCDDGAFCTVLEFCSAGSCAGGSPTDCDDGNACTSDVCNEGTDVCDHPAVAEGTVCDDGEYCTLGDQCTAGTCSGPSARNCSDSNPCTTDSCDEVGDACLNINVANGTACDDGEYCTLGEVCTAGSCAGGAARNCSDGNDCTADSCDDISNTCVNANQPNGTGCNDGIFCTVGELCTAGSCGGGSPRNCSDGNQCTSDVCDEAGNVCDNQPIADGSVCDDGQYCSNGDQCLAGACQPGPARNCSDGDQCTIDSCNEATNACVNETAAADGILCNDGQFCTIGERCLGGACQGGTPYPCSDGNQCTADSCDEANDACLNDAVGMNGAACDDGNYCTIGDSCNAGFCNPSSARNCADTDPCTSDSCNGATNSCEHSPVTNGTPCDDGVYCSIGSTCNAGACGGGVPNTCADGNDCTTDSCNEAGMTCDHVQVANGSPCDDGLYCNIGSTCSAGACGGGAPNACDDGQQCTFDTCNEATDSCSHDAVPMNGAPCDDGNFCMVGETCNAGSCSGGTVLPCDDGNSCTTDSCDEGNDVCRNLDRPNGAACDDGQFCSAGDNCLGGICQPGAAQACADGNPCTNDSCDEGNDLCAYGCVPAGTRCLDATQEATCDGACNATQLVICSFACNAVRQECNQCNPNTLECRADLEYLCNAEFVCDANGLIQSKTCCSSNRCTCDGSVCLEDICATAPDVSSGGNFNGNTCDDLDNIPGDCYPGGPACRSVAAGGSPEEFFQFTLDDGQPTSAFYTVRLVSAGYDTTLRTSTVCGSETDQVPTADVCGGPPPGIDADQACSEEAGPETMELCGLPEGTYFGSVDSAAGTCGAYNLNVNVSQVDLDDGPAAGNITMGGTFTGNTCALADDFSFPSVQGINGCTGLGNCVNMGESSNDCPACDASSATDCDIGLNSADSLCAYNGAGGPDAVFYLSLQVDSGIDISTVGSNFDTVLFIMETGPNGTADPGSIRLCNDDCYSTSSTSHIQTSLPAGLYYVYLDGAGGDCGNYQLNVVVSPAATCPNLGCDAPQENCVSCPFDCACPNCPDGVVDTAEGEECDDNNAADGDGCNSRCVIEDGYTCSGQPSSCLPQFFVDETSSCSCTIPDGGIMSDTISVLDHCTISAINIDMDINHTYRGDISLDLLSPVGTPVRLKVENIGDNGTNITGNYEATLTVDGPGALSDYLGEDAFGVWILTAQDHWTPDQGVLNRWTVHLTCQ